MLIEKFKVNILNMFLLCMCNQYCKYFYEVNRNLDMWFNSDFSFIRHIKKPLRFALVKSGISSNSDGISHEMLLFWQLMLCLVADLTTVIPCL